MGVAAQLGAQPGHRRVLEVRRHDLGRATVEGERRNHHPAVPDGHKVGLAGDVLLLEQGDRVGAVGGRAPLRVTRCGRPLPGLAAPGSALVDAWIGDLVAGHPAQPHVPHSSLFPNLVPARIGRHEVALAPPRPAWTGGAPRAAVKYNDPERLPRSAPTLQRRLRRADPDPLAALRARGQSLFADYEVGHLLWLVDLDVVPGAVQQVQLAVGEQRGEVAGDPRVEVAIAGAEDHPDRLAEAAQLRDAPPTGEHGAEQVVVEAPERRPGGQELLVQLWHELLTHFGVLDEAADLPGVQAPVQIGPPQDQGAGGRADYRRGVQRDGRRAP